MNRTSATGALIGIILGIIIPFLYPNVLNIEFRLEQMVSKLLGYPYGQWSFKGGSIYSVGLLSQLIFGIIGGFLGYIISRKKYHK